MDTLTVVGILIGFLTLALGGVLSSVEAAVVTISRARVENLVKEDKPGAERLLRLVTDKARHVNLLVLLRTISEVTGAVLAAGLACAGGVAVYLGHGLSTDGVAEARTTCAPSMPMISSTHCLTAREMIAAHDCLRACG